MSDQPFCHLVALISARLKLISFLRKPSSAQQLQFYLSGRQQGRFDGIRTRLGASPVSPVLPPALPWPGPRTWGSRGAGGTPAELPSTHRAQREPLHSPGQPPPAIASSAASAIGAEGKNWLFLLLSWELLITSGSSRMPHPSRRLSLSKASLLPNQFILSY